MAHRTALPADTEWSTALGFTGMAAPSQELQQGLSLSVCLQVCPLFWDVRRRVVGWAGLCRSSGARRNNPHLGAAGRLAVGISASFVPPAGSCLCK